MSYLRLTSLSMVGTLLLVLPSIAIAQDNLNVLRDDVRARVNTPKRRFAEGVLVTIPMKFEAKDTFTKPGAYIDIVQGIPGLDWQPNYLANTRTLKSMASDVVFRRDIWGLEFSFKPVRMIEVDVPQPSGKLQRKLVWYMVYRIRNLGDPVIREKRVDDFGNVVFESRRMNELPLSTIRFFPRFVLESKDGSASKEYLDRILPTAMQPIQARETGGAKLYNSVEISKFDIPVTTADESNAIWGVATWTDIDPNTDYFSIYVQGLTNAFEVKDDPSQFASDEKPLAYRKYLDKTLKLNFWRPGDTLDENEREIKFGIPGEVEYKWIYR